MVYNVEKQLAELPAEAPAELKSGIQTKIDAVKDALKNDNLDAIKSSTAELEATLEQLYNAAQQAQAAAGGAAPDTEVDDAGPAAASSEPRQAKGKVVEAEVVDK